MLEQAKFDNPAVLTRIADENNSAGSNDKKTLDYGAVLADLHAKRAALDQLIVSLQVASASGALVATANDGIPPMADSVGTVAGIHGGEVPNGAFLGKSIPEAAKLCLQIFKRKMTSREIADNLLKGGIETTSKRFPTILHSILSRSSARPAETGIIKLGSQWGLADWYPAALRSPSSKRAGGSTGRKKPKGQRVKRYPRLETPPEAEQSIPVRVRAAISKPGVELSAQEVAEKAGTKVNVAMMLLGGLVKKGVAEKTGSGRYRAKAA